MLKNLWWKQSFCYNQCLSIAYLQLRQRSILRRKEEEKIVAKSQIVSNYYMGLFFVKLALKLRFF